MAKKDKYVGKWTYLDSGEELPGYPTRAQPGDTFNIDICVKMPDFRVYKVVHKGERGGKKRTLETAYFTADKKGFPSNLLDHDNGAMYFVRYMKVMKGKRLMTYAAKLPKKMAEVDSFEKCNTKGLETKKENAYFARVWDCSNNGNDGDEC